MQWSRPLPLVACFLLALLGIWAIRRHQYELRTRHTRSPALRLRVTIALASLGVAAVAAAALAASAGWLSADDAHLYARFAGGGAIVLSLVALRSYAAARRSSGP